MVDYTAKTVADGDINLLGLWHKAALRLFDFSGKAVLDIGCGTGSFLYYLKDKARLAEGIDPNPTNTQIANEHGLKVFTGFLEDKKEIFKNRIAVCTCFEVIEHLFSPASIFNAAREILPTGGFFIVSTPNAFNVARALDFVFLQEHHDPLMDPTKEELGEHIRGWSYNMLGRAFSQAGFKLAKRRGFARVRGKIIVFKNSFLVKYFSQNLLFVGQKI